MKKSQNPQCNTNKQPPKPQAGDSEGTQKALNVFQKTCNRPLRWLPQANLLMQGNVTNSILICKGEQSIV